jgi:hypothetical protein
LLAKKDHFSNDSKYGTIKNQRPELPSTQSALFGVKESFKTLNID